MVITETRLKGCYILTPTVHKDNRGYFFESFNKREFEKRLGQSIDFVQDNQARSTKGVLRGLHFQKGEFVQAKLIRVLQGEVLDVAVDLREDSATFGEYAVERLSADNKMQMFIPKGFAHGYLVLSDNCEFYYKCDNYYNPSSEGGIVYDDPDLAIDWQFPNIIKVSEKDKSLPRLAEFLTLEYKIQKT